MILETLLILFTGVISAGWVVSAVIAVVSAVHSYTQQRKMKKKAEREADARKGFELTLKGEARSLPICYGRTMVGSTVTDVKVRHDYSFANTTATGTQVWSMGLMNQSQNPKKSRNEFLIAQYAFCQGGINSIKHVEIDDLDYNDSELRRDKKYGHRVVTNTQGGTADPLATANLFPSSNTFTDVCFATGAYYLHRDDPQFGGIPELKVYLEGLKICQVIKSGDSYSYSRTGTKVYTTNSAWILLDYLTAEYGAQLPISALNLKSFYDAAQVCQQGVNTSLGMGAIQRQGKVWRGSNGGSLASNAGNNFFRFTESSDLIDEYGSVSAIQSLGPGRFHTASNSAQISPDSEYEFNFSNVYQDSSTGELRVNFSNITGLDGATVPGVNDVVIPGDVSSFWQNIVTGANGLPLYECNLTLDPSSPVRDNVDQILFTMGNADMVYSEGQYKLNLIYPSDNAELQTIAANTLVVTDDILKNSEIKVTYPSNATKLNQCTVRYSNEQDNFNTATATWPETGSTIHTTYLTEDQNIVLNTSITVDGISDPYHATARAEQTVRESRRAVVYEFEVFSEGYALEPGDYIQFNSEVNGLTASTDVALVRSVELTTQMTIKVEAIKTNALDLAWNIGDEELSPEPSYANFESLAPVLTDSEISDADLSDDTVYGYKVINDSMSIFLRWQEQEDATLFEKYEIEAQLGDEVEEGWFQIGTTRNENFTYIPGRPTDVLYFRIRVVSANGRKSPWSNILGGLSVQYVTPADTAVATLEQDLNTIEVETGEILEREDGSGAFVPSTLSDLATYYKDTELDAYNNFVSVRDDLEIEELARIAGDIDNTNYVDSQISTVQGSLNTSVSNLNASIDAVQDDLDDQVGILNQSILDAENAASSATATVQSQVDSLQNTVTDITAATADVYLQDDAPVAGVDGVPDPISDNSRWYDSDDGNHPYVWDGTQWLSIRDGTGQSNANEISRLAAIVDDVDSGVVATSDALSVLDTTVSTQGDDISTVSGRVTDLETTIDDSETGFNAVSSAVDSLQTTVSTHGNDISTNSQDITTLESTVNDAETGVAANAGAISSLSTTVSTQGGDILTNSQDITALESTVNDAETGVAANAGAVDSLSTTVSTQGDDILANSQDITALESTVNDAETGVAANAGAISSLNTTVLAQGGDITANSNAITALETAVDDPDTGLSANAGAIDSLETRVTATEDVNTVQATDITTLNADLVFRNEVSEEIGNTVLDELGNIVELENDLSVVVALSSQATNALDTRVTQNEQDMEARASEITQLQSDVLDNNQGISGNSTAIDSLETLTTSQGSQISANASDISSLQSTLTTAEGNISATSTALSSLTTRVTTNEGDISATQSSLTSLTGRVDDTENDISANTSAISGLSSTVYAVDGVTAAWSSDITVLSNSISGTGGINDRLGTLETADPEMVIFRQADEPTTTIVGAVWYDSNDNFKPYIWDGSLWQPVQDPRPTANSFAISALESDVYAADGVTAAWSSDITALNNSINGTGGIISRLGTLETADSEMVVFRQSDEPTTTIEGALWFDINDNFKPYVWDGTQWQPVQDNRIGANSTAISELASDVYAADGVTAAWSSDIVALNNSISGTDGLDSRVNTLENADPEMVVFRQSNAPTTTIVGAVWYDINDNFKPYIWDGSVWQPVQDSRIGINSTAISELTSDVYAADGVTAAWSSDIVSLNNSISGTNGINDRLGTLETADPEMVVFAQNDEPTTGLVTGALWVDTDDNNKLYRYNGTDWVAIDDSRIDANSNAISELTSDVYAADGVTAAWSADITSLTNSISGTNGINDRLGTLETADPEMVVFVQDDEPTADLVEGALWFDSNDNNKPYFYNGTAWVAVVDSRISANSTAISALESDVYAADGVTAAWSSDITELQNDLTFRREASLEVGSAIEDENGNIVQIENDISHVVEVLSTADNALSSRVTQNEQDVEAVQDDLTLLTGTVSDLGLDLAAESTALDLLTSRVASTESGVSVNQGSITALSGRVDDTEGDISTNTSAISTLESTVYAADGVTAAWSSDIVSLNNSISGTGGVTERLGTLETADPEMVVFRQSSEPSAANAVEGAIWYDTNDNMKPYVFVSGVWIAVQDPRPAVNSQAISELSSDVYAADGVTAAWSSDITTLNNSISGTGGLNDRLGTLETADPEMVVFRQSDEPTTTIVGAVWYDINDNFKPYIWDGSLWQPVQDNRIGTNSSAISALESDVYAADGVTAAWSSDIVALNNSISGTNGINDRLGTLETADPDMVVFRQSSEPTTTIVGAVWYDINDNFKPYIWDGSVWQPVQDNRIEANSSAISALESDVYAADGVTAAWSSDIVSLNNSISGTGGINDRLGILETADPDMVVFNQASEPTTDVVGALWVDSDDSNKLYIWDGSNWVNATPDIAGMTVFNQASPPTTDVVGALWFDSDDNFNAYVWDGSAWQSIEDPRIGTNSTAVSELQSSVYEADGSTVAWSADITALQTTVNDPTSGVDATASAVSGLSTRVGTVEGEVADLEAEYYVDLDVNGHVSGIRLYNTGTTSSFTVTADEFKVVKPYVDGETPVSAAPFAIDTAGTISMNADVEINGNLIVDGTITQGQMGDNSVGSDQVINGSVGANELEISANNSGSGERMYFNGTDNRIEIFDTNDVVRVALGNLTGL